MLAGPGEHLFLFRAEGQYHIGGIRQTRAETLSDPQVAIEIRK